MTPKHWMIVDHETRRVLRSSGCATPGSDLREVISTRYARAWFPAADRTVVRLLGGEPAALLIARGWGVVTDPIEAASDDDALSLLLAQTRCRSRGRGGS